MSDSWGCTLQLILTCLEASAASCVFDRCSKNLTKWLNYHISKISFQKESLSVNWLLMHKTISVFAFLQNSKNEPN